MRFPNVEMKGDNGENGECEEEDEDTGGEEEDDEEEEEDDDDDDDDDEGGLGQLGRRRGDPSLEDKLSSSLRSSSISHARVGHSDSDIAESQDVLLRGDNEDKGTKRGEVDVEFDEEDQYPSSPDQSTSSSSLSRESLETAEDSCREKVTRNLWTPFS